MKICGVTTVADAIGCAKVGVDAIGLNFVPGSPRRIEEEAGRAIVEALAGEVGDRVLIVGVVANRSADEMRALRRATGVGCLQLHGDESPADVAAVLPHAYKAVPIEGAQDVAGAEAMPGEYLLVDARVPGLRGGTGRSFDWRLVAGLAARRRLVLAGGLSPANVQAAIAVVHPFCVDVASGVESAPGRKDLAMVEAFVARARSV